MVGWLFVLRISVALAVFQPYRDLEAGDNQSLKFKWRGRESNPGPLAPQAKSLTTRPPPLPSDVKQVSPKLAMFYIEFQISVGISILLVRLFQWYNSFFLFFVVRFECNIWIFAPTVHSSAINQWKRGMYRTQWNVHVKLDRNFSVRKRNIMTSYTQW